MEESRRMLKLQQSPPASDTRDVMEISQRATETTDKRQDSVGTPLDLSRRSPHTPPSGLTAATVPGVGPLSPCHGARPPSRPAGLGGSEERRLATETVPQTPASTPSAASSSISSDHANIAAGPIATQVTTARLSWLVALQSW